MSEKSKTSLNKEIQNKAKSRIDSKAESIEPIDYSFKDLMSLEGFSFFLCKQLFKQNT